MRAAVDVAPYARLDGATASAADMRGAPHGGAGQRCMTLMRRVGVRAGGTQDDDVLAEAVAVFTGAAAVHRALGFASCLGRGRLVVARSIGLLVHAGEQGPSNARCTNPVPTGVLFRHTDKPRRTVSAHPSASPSTSH
jgi:citrate synthase